MRSLPSDVLNIVYAKCGVRGRALMASTIPAVKRTLWTKADESILLTAYAHRKGRLEMTARLAEMLVANRTVPEAAEILRAHARDPHVRCRTLMAAITTMAFSDPHAYPSATDLRACGDDLRSFLGTQTPAAFDAFQRELPEVFRLLCSQRFDAGDVLRAANMALLAHLIWRIHAGDLWPDMRDGIDQYVTARNVLRMVGCPGGVTDAAWQTVLALAISKGDGAAAKIVMAAGHRFS